MALSPRDRDLMSLAVDPPKWTTVGGGLKITSEAMMKTFLDAARAQGRASLEERCKVLESGVEAIRSWANEGLNGGSIVRTRRLEDIADEADALLATPGEQSQ